MRDIREYVIRCRVRRFFIKLGLRAIINYRHRPMEPATTRTNKKGKQLIISNSTKEYLSLKEAIFPSIFDKNTTTYSYVSRYNTQ